MNWKNLHIDVEYAYKVEGVEYVTKRVTFCDIVNKPMSSLDKILDQYLEAEKVTVYYNPRDHGDSVLIPGVKVMEFYTHGDGLGFYRIGRVLAVSPGVKKWVISRVLSIG